MKPLHLPPSLTIFYHGGLLFRVLLLGLRHLFLRVILRSTTGLFFLRPLPSKSHRGDGSFLPVHTPLPLLLPFQRFARGRDPCPLVRTSFFPWFLRNNIFLNFVVSYPVHPARVCCYVPHSLDISGNRLRPVFFPSSILPPLLRPSSTFRL